MLEEKVYYMKGVFYSTIRYLAKAGGSVEQKRGLNGQKQCKHRFESGK